MEYNKRVGDGCERRVGGLYVSADTGITYVERRRKLTIAMGGSGGGADKSGILTSRYSFACTAGGTSLDGEVLD